MVNKILQIVGVTVFALFLAQGASAQQAQPSSKLGWDQQAADVNEANSFTYKYYPDAAPTGTVLASVVCTGATAPFLCQAPFPAFTPGPHSLTLSASNAGGESLKSTALTFTFVVIPSPPTNLRIQ